MRISLLCTLLLAANVAAVAADNPTDALHWTNPIVEQRADGQVALQPDGYYYFTATVPEYDRLEIRRAKTLAGLRDGETKVVWHKHDTGIMASHIWAPELHRLDGKWYLYFSAGGQPNVWDIRLYVLENDSPDPFQGDWVEKGEIKTKWESFALDPTVFEWKGARYLVWAQKDPAFPRVNSNLYIAKMDTPWSITGEQVMISKPDLAWEQIGYQVNEGPAVLIHGGKIFITYSASATDFNYCLGMVTANADANLLEADSWTKSPRPVFATWTVNGVYGPGHNSFTTTPDGKTDLMMYHARSYRDIQGDPLNDPNRSERVQVVNYHADGTPDFGVPVAEGPYAVEGSSAASMTVTSANGTPVMMVPLPPVVTIVGQVYHPGRIPVPAGGGLTLGGAIALAGGFNPTADHIVDIHRLRADGTTQEINGINASGDGKSFELQMGDQVFVYQSVMSQSYRRP